MTQLQLYLKDKGVPKVDYKLAETKENLEGYLEIMEFKEFDPEYLASTEVLAFEKDVLDTLKVEGDLLKTIQEYKPKKEEKKPKAPTKQTKPKTKKKTETGSFEQLMREFYEYKEPKEYHTDESSRNKTLRKILSFFGKTANATTRIYLKGVFYLLGNGYKEEAIRLTNYEGFPTHGTESVIELLEKFLAKYPNISSYHIPIEAVAALWLIDLDEVFQNPFYWIMAEELVVATPKEFDADAESKVRSELAVNKGELKQKMTDEEYAQEVDRLIRLLRDQTEKFIKPDSSIVTYPETKYYDFWGTNGKTFSKVVPTEFLVLVSESLGQTWEESEVLKLAAFVDQHLNAIKWRNYPRPTFDSVVKQAYEKILSLVKEIAGDDAIYVTDLIDDFVRNSVREKMTSRLSTPNEAYVNVAIMFRFFGKRKIEEYKRLIDELWNTGLPAFREGDSSVIIEKLGVTFLKYLRGKKWIFTKAGKTDIWHLKYNENKKNAKKAPPKKTPVAKSIETPLGNIKEEDLQYDKTIAWVTSKITQLQSLGKDARKNAIRVVLSLVDSYFREEYERKRIVQYIRAFGLEDRRKDILTTLGILLKKHDKDYDRYSRYDTVLLQTSLFSLFLHVNLKFKIEAANKTAIDIFSLNKNYSESVREGAKASGIEVIDTDSVRLLFEQIKLSFIDRKLTEKQIVIPKGGKIPSVAIHWTDLGGGMSIGTPKYIIEGENDQGRFKVFPIANDESSLSFILSHGGKHFPISKKEGDRLLEQSKKAQEKPKPDPENTLTIKNNGAIPASVIKWVKLDENLFMGTPKVPIRLDKNTLVFPPNKSTKASTKLSILSYLNILFPLTQTERNRILNWEKKREVVSKPEFKESEKADSFLPLPPPVKKWMEAKIEAFRKKEADGKITATDFIIEDVVRDRKKGTLIFRVHHPKKILFPKANIYISSEGKIQSTSTQGLRRGSYQVLISKATFKRLYSTLQNSEVCTLATLAIFGKERGNEFDKLSDGVSPGMYLQKCGNLYARKEKRSQLHKKAKEIYEKAKAEGFAYGKVLAYTSKQFLQYGENGLKNANLKGLKAWLK